MKNHHNTNDDYEIINGRKILKDGRTYRARMTMMDSAMPHRPSFARVTDGTGDPMGLHRPGWRVPAQDARPLVGHVVTDAVANARRQYVTDLENAWRTPPNGWSAPPSGSFGGDPPIVRSRLSGAARSGDRQGQ
jgi:hypothetical protein